MSSAVSMEDLPFSSSRNSDLFSRFSRLSRFSRFSRFSLFSNFVWSSLRRDSLEDTSSSFIPK